MACVYLWQVSVVNACYSLRMCVNIGQADQSDNFPGLQCALDEARAEAAHTRGLLAAQQRMLAAMTGA